MATLEIKPFITSLTTWTSNPFGSAATQYLKVNEGSGAIDEDDYIYTSSTGRQALFNSTDPGTDLSSATISQVEIFVRAKQENTSNLKIIAGNPADLTYDASGTITIGTDWTTYSNVWTESPFTSAAWTSDNIDDFEMGVFSYIGLGRSKKVYVATIWAIVTYTTGAAGYGNDVIGVASANISTVNGIATANISKVNGV